jgi:Fe2+ or Zn2+ uptake regulation protein
MTKYAKQILQIVSQSHDHMTAEQVFLALRQTYPKVVLATVYNNLNRLCAEGLIRRISLEGMPERYDRMQKHDHLVCRSCGKLLDIVLDDLTQHLQEQVEVPILSYDLKLMYVCDACRNRQIQAEGRKDGE